MRYAFINNFSQALAADLAAGATTLTLDGGGTQMADASTDYRYKLTLVQTDAFGNETHREIVDVTGASGDTLTIVRQQESTTSLSPWPSGTTVAARVTAGHLAGFAPELIAFGPVDFSDAGSSASWQAPAGRKLYVDAVEVVPSASGVPGAWTTDTGTPTLTGNARQVAYSPNGTWLAIAHSASPYLTVLDTSTWSIISTPALTNTAYALDFSPDSSRLAVGYADSPYLAVLDTSTWTTVSGTPTAAGRPYGVKYSPDGSLLAVVLGMTTAPHCVEIYTVSTWAVSTYIDDTANSVDWSPSGGHLAVALYNSPGITVFETATWTTETVPAMDSYTYAVAFSNDGAYLAAGDQFGDYLVIYETTGWTVTATPSMPAGVSYVAALAWQPVTDTLAVGHDGTGFLTMLTAGTWAEEVSPTPNDSARGLAFDATGNQLAIATWATPYLQVDDYAALATPTVNLGVSSSDATGLLSGHTLAVFDNGRRIVAAVDHAPGVDTLYAEPGAASDAGAPATLIVRGYTLEA